MSEVINPKIYPQLAAQQIVVELIRAGKLGTSNFDSQAEKVIKVFNEIEGYFTEKYKSKND